jgi:CRISPR/Cas system endoribonuclease Cas6 (RAMP superfamily)
MIRIFKYAVLIVLFSPGLFAQKIKLTDTNLKPVGIYLSQAKVKGSKAIRVVKDSTIILDDEPTYARINNLEFTQGVIEVKVLSKILKNAPSHARGFIGVAFHINEDNSKFEAIYLRPANAMVEDQLRRNRSTQYFAYPDFKFTDSRKVAPGVYESYQDMELNKWITLKIVVKNQQAKLYIDGRKQPSLVVNDLKLGLGAKGGIGLFVDIGTEGFFKDLVLYKQ